jgi:hypothetical protein
VSPAAELWSHPPLSSVRNKIIMRIKAWGFPELTETIVEVQGHNIGAGSNQNEKETREFRSSDHCSSSAKVGYELRCSTHCSIELLIYELDELEVRR